MTNMPHNALIEKLPHRRMEAWKWTDVRGAVSGAQSGMTSACEPEISVLSRYLTRESISPSDTPMSKLAANFGGDAYVITVPAGDEVHVQISNLTQGHAHIVFRLGEGAKLTVEEIHDCGEYGSVDPRFVNLDIRFELAQFSQLTRSVYHDHDGGATRIVTANINAWTGADIAQHALSFGSALTRFETRIAALGEGVGIDIHGAYLLNSKRHCDMTSYIDLGAASTHVRQSVKGVVADNARGVFQGKFHVRRPAQLADATMRHDAIMLSDAAQIRSKPELEIYADDVACAHGNTVGTLDESALFYMQQRGIPLWQAKALLIQAFVLEAFETVKDESTKHWFSSYVEDWLEENS